MLFTLIYEIIMLMFYSVLFLAFICWVVLPIAGITIAALYWVTSTVGGAYLYTNCLLKRIITKIKSGT
ncbi:hypothetical protein UFOVP671_17 [uncultured Caudovirales phage]|uniref:Uncharacterized protein n=1 Tax=uncultured Caudovirales phage TaxID=2100421 RepID=A0A6J5NCD8_9CAUD|nr:hypothetical protein UFOVP671_17 [uncultured Caudovirales phage]